MGDRGVRGIGGVSRTGPDGAPPCPPPTRPPRLPDRPSVSGVRGTGSAATEGGGPWHPPGSPRGRVGTEHSPTRAARSRGFGLGASVEPVERIDPDVLRPESPIVPEHNAPEGET